MRKDIATMMAIAAVVIGLGALLFLNDKPNSEPVTSGVSTAGSYTKGLPEAKVTVIEFADFQCPACAASVSALDNMFTKYPDKVRLVFKHFPLSQHSNAQMAALAAEAAGEQGKFWEMYNALYTTQTLWEDSNNPRGHFISLAQSLGLDTEKFDYAIDNRKFAEKIEADLQEGNSLNLTATPTFFINARRHVGVPDSEFESIIETELNK